jgi:iron(III) transport system ATP-binding protein
MAGEVEHQGNANRLGCHKRQSKRVDELLGSEHQRQRGKVTVLKLEALSKTFQRAGTVVNSVDLEILEGEFFTLLGPSGCGKSTILRMIAGLEEPDGGRILFEGRDVTLDPPNKRGIGMVFQNYALFPHLSVAQNVAFGLEVRKTPAAERNQRTASALKRVQLDSLGAARVDQLSGGQQQRVALARALIIQPKLLLLDEPLSNLDAKLRLETRAMLRSVHGSSKVTTIYVTHDQEEALGMSDRIAVLNSGNILQVGPPREIYERPATKFVADFIGHNNVIVATVESVSESRVVIRFTNGRKLSISPQQSAAGVRLIPEARVGVCVRAESLRFTDDAGLCSGVLTDVEYSGSGFSCIVKTDLGDLKMEIPGSVRLPAKDQTVRLAVTEEAVHLVEAA